MLSIPFSDWWCCLNPRESIAIKLLLISWFANNEYITQSAYTVIAFASGLAGLTLVNQYFIDHYGLTSGIVLDEEGNPISVYFFDSTLWPALYAFSLTEAFLCPDPCPNFRFWD